MKEASIAFGPGGGLVGTLCLPEDDGAARVALGMILFNAGVVHRIGPHRINVRLARRLALAGVPSLRFDLAGQGDSARPDGDLPFERQAVADLQAAMDALAQATGVGRFSIFGFCSGGCHGFAAAQADARIAGLILYDTYIYPTLKSRLNRYLVTIRHRGFANASGDWVRRLAASARRRLRASAAPAAPAIEARDFETPAPADFARVVRAMHARGARVGMMYSGGFEGFNYAGQFRDAFRATGIDAFVTCDYFPHLGHSTTGIGAQRDLIDRIEAWTTDLAREVARDGGAAAPVGLGAGPRG